jgi:signal transduction histidine kinase
MHTDEAKLRQVLSNLLDNAAKFTEGGTITLKANREQKDGRAWLIFQVVDTGVGIGADELRRIFTAFAEADREKRRKFGGTGVGLAISRYICQSMGGDVEASSVPGRGTVVTVRLPADGQAAPGAPMTAVSLA